MPTKISCNLINDNCVYELKTAYMFLFDSISSRDMYFSELPYQLANDGGLRTMSFVGTTSVTCQYWNGGDKPTTYNPELWSGTPLIFNALIGLNENAIVAVDGAGQPYESGMTVDSIAGEIVSSVPIRADIVSPTGSISFEGTTVVSTNSDTLEIRNCVEETNHEVLNVEYDDTGSYPVSYSKKNAIQEYVVHVVDDESSVEFESIFPTLTSVHWKDIIVKPLSAGSGSFTIYDNGPDKCVLNTLTTFNFQLVDVGIETIIPLKNRIKLSQGQFVGVKYSGVPLAGHNYTDDPVWGSQFVPYAKTKSQPYIDVKILDEYVYDPQGIASDSFNMGNMVESDTEKIFTANERSKLEGIENGAEVNVQPDWSQSLETVDDYIKNKPRFPRGGGYSLTPITTLVTLANTDYKVEVPITEWAVTSDFSWNDLLKRFEYNGPGANAFFVADMSSSNDTNNTRVKYVLCKNGVSVDAISTECDFVNNNKLLRVGFNCQTYLTTGDYFELCVAVDIASTTVTTSNIQFSVFSTD